MMIDKDKILGSEADSEDELNPPLCLLHYRGITMKYWRFQLLNASFSDPGKPTNTPKDGKWQITHF